MSDATSGWLVAPGTTALQQPDRCARHAGPGGPVGMDPHRAPGGRR